MALDNAKNFSKATVSTGYNASATSVVLTTGHGSKLPTAPFNCTWWNSSDYSDPGDDPNVEIIRVTNISSDTLTVTRGQEGISASTKNTAGKTYKIVAGLTAKIINTDLPAFFITQVYEDIVPNGVINGSNKIFTLNDLPKSDSLRVYLNGLKVSSPGDYDFSGQTITMVMTPHIGDLILVSYYI